MLGRLGNVVYWFGLGVLTLAGGCLFYEYLANHSHPPEGVMAMFGACSVFVLATKAVQYILGGTWTLPRF